MPAIKPEHRIVISEIARQNALPPAALLAVVDIESAGRVGTMIKGALHPTIRFEGHYFDRRLKGETRQTARQRGLASPSAGAIKNPRSQTARYAMLKRAKAIDMSAAIESTSWGVGQVMGSHWRMLGYQSATHFEAAMHEGLAGQVEAMVRFIVTSKLDKPLRARDWQAFARGYNGPAYAKNRYDEKLKQAYGRYAATSANDDAPFLRLGARGPAVKFMQAKLNEAGFNIHVDGSFGIQTASALKRFQQSKGLAPDGIFGPSTNAALRAQPAKESLIDQLNRLITRLTAFTKQLSRQK